DERQRRAGLARSANQRRHVLGKARAAITSPRMEKLVADAAIGADRGGDFLDVGADRLAQVGNLVDLHGEEGVGGIFGELGGFPAHEQRLSDSELSLSSRRQVRLSGAI